MMTCDPDDSEGVDMNPDRRDVPGNTDRVPAWSSTSTLTERRSAITARGTIGMGAALLKPARASIRGMSSLADASCDDLR